MTVFSSVRAAIAAAASAAMLTFGTGAASAATVQVTLEFPGTPFTVFDPYTANGFEIAGPFVELSERGNPFPSLWLDNLTRSLTLTRTGGGAFSLVSFDYSCAGKCDFSVGQTSITSGSTNSDQFVTFLPPASSATFANLTSLVFTHNSSVHFIDNIVLTYEDDLTPIPVPAALPLLLAGIGGLAMMARRKSRAA